MLRFVLGAVAVFGLCVAGARADDKKPDKANKGKAATITKVDQKAGTVTVRMKGDNGKMTNRTFHLTGEVGYFDSTGRVAAADIFRSGDEVLVVEEQGKLKEVHQKAKSDTGKTNAGKKPGGK
ncbi:MAG TPA: hypothetical protein VGF55_17705 [Gemmataceae bacterium]|jgi:hypothetical protein